MEHIGNEISRITVCRRKEPTRRGEKNEKQEVKEGDESEQTVITCE